MYRLHVFLFVMLLLGFGAFAQHATLCDHNGKPISYVLSGSGNGTPFSDSLLSVYKANCARYVNAGHAARVQGGSSAGKEESGMSPNPFSGELTLDFTDQEGGKAWAVTLFDSQGALLYSGSIQGQTEELSLPAVPNGIYALVLTAASGSSVVHKIIKE